MKPIKKAIWLIITLFSLQSCLCESEKGEIFLTEAIPSKGFNYLENIFTCFGQGCHVAKEPPARTYRDSIAGKMLPKRWKTCADIYKNEGINASIITYRNIGPEHPENVKQEIVEFFKLSLK